MPFTPAYGLRGSLSTPIEASQTDYARRDLEDRLINLELRMVGAALRGEVKLWPTSAAPNGFLTCNGAAVSRVSYSALFDVLGTTWGAGDGSTTFNVPDLRGRTPVGIGTGPGLTARSIGGYFGAEGVVLTTAQLASHNHTGATGGMNSNQSHGHTLGGTSNSGGTFATSDWQGAAGHAGWGGVVGRVDTNGLYWEYLTANDTNINHTHPIPAEGANQAHPNVQPSTAMNFIIRY